MEETVISKNRYVSVYTCTHTVYRTYVLHAITVSMSVIDHMLNQGG